MNKLSSLILQWSARLRKQQVWIVFAFLVMSVILKLLERAFLANLHVSSLGMYFYSNENWRHLTNAMRCTGAHDHFVSFIWIDFFFFISYGLLLLCLVSRFTVRRWRILFFVLSGILIVSDIIENCYFLFHSGFPPVDIGEQHCPWASGIKFTALGILVIMLMSNWVGRSVELLKMALFTLWYCRFSVIGVLLFFVFLKAPQGREMLVYMLESDMDWLYMPVFALSILITGMVIYYMPRFLYPENPAAQKYTFPMTFCFKYWVNHLKEGPDDGGEKSLTSDADASQFLRRREFEVVRKSLSNLSETESKGISLQDPDDREVTRWIIRFRKYTPLVLVALYCMMLISAFFKMYGSIGPEKEEHHFLIDGIFFGVRCFVIVFFILLIASPGFKKKVLSGVLKYFQTKWVNITLFALAFLSMVLLVFGIRNDTMQNVLLSLITLTFGILLLICSVSHHSGKSKYLTAPLKQVFHVLIITGLCVSAAFYLVYLSFFTMIYSLGLVTFFLIFAFYSVVPFLLAYKGRDPNHRSYFLSVFVLITFVALIVATNIDNNHLDVDTKPYSTHAENIEDYVRRFVRLHEGDTSKSIPVYFIAANGGGTMQAYWTASVLAWLRDSTAFEIDSHIFAMSGASGGAEGMAISVMAWDEREKFYDRIDCIYSHDYLSGGLAYMFGCDLWASALPFNMSWLRNRGEWFRDKYKKHLKQYLGHDKWMEPYRDAWRDTSRWLPLYFANTAQVENGQRWMVAPCDMHSVKSTGKSLLDELLIQDKTLNFSEAVLLSSRFPYVSTSGKIDGLGHFVDGGYHDNSGIETLLEVYEAVKGTLLSDPRFKAKFIHINFGTGAWKKYQEWDDARSRCTDALNGKEISETLVPPFAAYSNLLAEPVYDRVERMMNNGHDVRRIYLPGAEIFSPRDTFVDEQTRKEFAEEIDIRLIETPLGRTISRNQKEFVKRILKEPKIQPGGELEKILRDFD